MHHPIQCVILKTFNFQIGKRGKEENVMYKTIVVRVQKDFLSFLLLPNLQHSFLFWTKFLRLLLTYFPIIVKNRRKHFVLSWQRLPLKKIKVLHFPKCRKLQPNYSLSLSTLNCVFAAITLVLCNLSVFHMHRFWNYEN